MKRSLLKLGVAGLLAATAAIAFAPPAQAVCASKDSPPNGFELVCPGPGVFYKLKSVNVAYPGADSVTSSSTGSANIRATCQPPGIGQPFVMASRYWEGPFPGNFDKLQKNTCTSSKPNILQIKCGDTPDCLE